MKTYWKKGNICETKKKKVYHTLAFIKNTFFIVLFVCRLNIYYVKYSVNILKNNKIGKNNYVKHVSNCFGNNYYVFQHI